MGKIKGRLGVAEGKRLFASEKRRSRRNVGKKSLMTRFPAVVDERAVWFEKLGLKQCPENVSKYARICSVHFEEKDFEVKPSGKIFLKKGARPRFYVDEYVPPTSRLDNTTEESTTDTASENDCFEVIESSDSPSPLKRKSSEGNQLDQPPEAPQLVLLPECRPDDGAEIKSEPDDQILQPVPECSSRNPEEYLPENPPIANHAKDVAKQSIPKRHFGKVVCRMCLESAAKTQMVPLTTWDVNYAGRSEAYKQNKILQTERVNSMINVVMPNFDFDIAYNPMICHKCVARLESAFNFIEECKESEKVIHSYKTKFASHQELVSCDDVAQNRRLLEKEESRRKRRKSSKQHDNDRLVTSSPLGQNESISAGDTSQVEVHEFERVDCGESQESITMETNSEIMTSIKSEREDLECDDSEGNSFLINTADLTSVIVKEEVSVKEEVPCDFNDLPTNDQHCDLIVKDEAYSLTIAYGTDENDEYHRDSALSRKRKEMDPGT
ncbi:uncharacterized protein isoform X3 [Leptinotarsa decemlineata]|uniref:uncharacterized protein isoform X3 n=1 Tax=Leptinotarsa decemlineata TaxID=7539 RepID=UPI003D3087E8